MNEWVLLAVLAPICFVVGFVGAAYHIPLYQAVLLGLALTLTVLSGIEDVASEEI